MSKKLAEKLADKIEKELGIICEPETFKRTYAGYWQKLSGAFVWTMKVLNSHNDIGSCTPASECIKRKYNLSITENGMIDIELQK